MLLMFSIKKKKKYKTETTLTTIKTIKKYHIERGNIKLMFVFL